MSGDGASFQFLKNRTAIMLIAGTFLIAMIWLLAFYGPEGRKLTSVQNQTQQARTQQGQLELQLARLKVYSKDSGALDALSQRLTAAVPPTEDIYDYVTSLSDAATASGVKITSVDPGSPEPSGSIAVIPVSVQIAGTYDHSLSFIQALYALPRLTIITGLELNGGGSTANRGSALQDTFSLVILAQPSAIPPTSSSSG